MALIGVLCPLEFTTLVGTTLLSPILSLDEIFIPLLNPLPRLVGITIPYGIYVTSVLAETHRYDT